MFLELAHTRLDVFKISKTFVLLCYKTTRSFPPEEKYVLTQQIRRAALSVHLNIAEGSSRRSMAERRRYYEIARGPVIEIDTALDIATALEYTNKATLEELGKYLLRCFQLLFKMM
jgi:four helix bundle protein